jgi:dephospho-CoA kinase
MDEADARARIAAQAGEEQRRRVADVWLDNSGSEGQLVAQARELWSGRILPFAHNLALRAPTPDPAGLVPADPRWPDQAARIRARLATHCGHRALRIDHIGSTAITGMDARDIIDLQVTVAAIQTADELAEDLLRAGYPRVDSITADRRHDDSNAMSDKRFHASADPGRPTHVHIRVDGDPNQRFALLFVDWLQANAAVRADYLAVKRRADADQTAVMRWLGDAYPRASAWAEGTDWSPRPMA